MPSDKLTELGLRKAKPSSKPKKLSDGGGLFLLLHPSGSKYWRMKYRIIGKEKLLAIGVWPEVSLIEARKKRNEAKQLLKSGKDPSAAKKNLKVSQKVAQSNTFGSVTEEWLEIKQRVHFSHGQFHPRDFLGIGKPIPIGNADRNWGIQHPPP